MNLLNQQIKLRIQFFCKKVAIETICKYNLLKIEIKSNESNQDVTDIQLDAMFTNVLQEVKADKRPLRKPINKNIIAIIMEKKLIDNRTEASLEMHTEFCQKDIIREIGG